jgi:hypothetical protein
MFPLRERRKSATARNSRSDGLKQEDSPEIGSKKVGNFLNSLKKEVNYTNYASHDKTQVS